MLEYACILSLTVCMHAYMYVCLTTLAYVCMYVCMYSGCGPSWVRVQQTESLRIFERLGQSQHRDNPG